MPMSSPIKACAQVKLYELPSDLLAPKNLFVVSTTKCISTVKYRYIKKIVTRNLTGS